MPHGINIIFMNYNDYIESNSNIMLGKPLVKGTRITVELILKNLAEGASFEDIIFAYPHLTPISIQAVLAYAYEVIANEVLINAA